MNRIFTTVVLAVAAHGVALADRAKDTRRAPGSLTQTVTVAVVYSADVTAAFEDVDNLSPTNLGLSATLVTLPDLALISRLPDPAVTLPAGFPVLISIDPVPAPVSGLEFDGVAMVTVDTENLPYSPDTRLRLFSANDALSPFIDITEEVSEGSYRVRGSRGEFSEFLIVHDGRDSAAIVNTKFARIDSLLSTHSASITEPALVTTLNNLIDTAETNWLANDIDAAKAGVQSFGSAVEGALPGVIPDTWRSVEDVVNVAGLLRAAAGTLYFSLEDARDSDLDGIYDYTDNCTLVENVSQCDYNGDGFGNHCDADLNDDGIVNSFDLSQMRANFGATGSNAADLDCNGIVNSFDLSRMRNVFGNSPGPAAP